jgi:hypothetical protein
MERISPVFRPSFSAVLSTSIIIIIILFAITFLQGAYKPETNLVTKVCSVAAILLLQYMLHLMIFPTLKVA